MVRYICRYIYHLQSIIKETLKIFSSKSHLSSAYLRYGNFSQQETVIVSFLPNGTKRYKRSTALA